MNLADSLAHVCHSLNLCGICEERETCDRYERIHQASRGEWTDAELDAAVDALFSGIRELQVIKR